jgi:hypothetical protein
VWKARHDDTEIAPEILEYASATRRASSTSARTSPRAWPSAPVDERAEGVQVDVFEEDRSGLAAQFHGRPLQLPATGGRDGPAGAGGAGEGDLAHERMPDERGTSCPAAADNVRHPGGMPAS